MSKKDNIDIQHFIRNGKLVTDKSFSSLLDKGCIYTIFLLAAIIPIYFFSQINWYNSNDRFIAITILLPILCFAVYGFFRKSQEDRVYKYDISLSTEETKKMIETFLDVKGYSIVSKAKSRIYARRQSELGYNNLWTYDLTFVFNDEVIWMNISRQIFGLNWPVFFSQYFLKRDLKMFLDKYLTN